MADTPTSPVTARLGWEHTHREMLPALLFLHHVRSRGLAASLEHVGGLTAGAGGREVVMTPFYYDDFELERYLYQVGLVGKWVVNLAYEQMHLPVGRPYLLPDGRFAAEQMLHCAWGPRFQELLIAHGIPAERIRLTGHPRFDIYHHPSLLLPREELAERYGLDAHKPWVLIPTSFNLAYITEKHRQVLIGRKYNVSKELIAATRNARDAFVDLVATLCEACPEVEVIVRAHPAGYENEAFYEKAGAERSNLHIISHFDIANWIRQSALTVVWTSTSAMEALVAGVPVVSYEPEPYGEVFEYDVNRILPTLTSLDAVVDVVKALPDPELTYDWARFQQWYQHRDGRNCERLADVVSEAAADYDSFAVTQDPAGFGTKARRFLTKLGLQKRPRKHDMPSDLVDASVANLDPRPMLDLLK